MNARVLFLAWLALLLLGLGACSEDNRADAPDHNERPELDEAPAAGEQDLELAADADVEPVVEADAGDADADSAADRSATVSESAVTRAFSAATAAAISAGAGVPSAPLRTPFTASTLARSSARPASIASIRPVTAAASASASPDAARARSRA